MPLQPNQVVSILFTLKDADGEIIDSTSDGRPFAFLSGNEQILPNLESEIGTMLIGSKKTVVLEPKDAYGEYQEEAVQILNRAEFPENAVIEEGQSYFTKSPEGEQIPFMITQIKGDEVTIDFNHPLAGETLSFDVELVNIRPATQEELDHGHAHGEGGHHHH
ncbi:MAG TPA: peptidylprolyl isomerase [Ignavibacteriaceae bacterium]|nr:peptidylprolyl isomerase [Ignavibacteriaceae bacterium]